MNIVLIGFKNSGKTSVGMHLATLLHRPFYDTDRLLETQYRTQKSEYQTQKRDAPNARAIHQNEGDSYFRALEKQVILSLESIHSSVIATGGGSLLDPENIHSLKKMGKLVYLQTAPAILLERIQNQAPVIPSFLDESNLKTSFYAHYEERQGLYSNAADVIIDTAISQ